MLLIPERNDWSTRLAKFVVRRRVQLLAVAVALATLAVFPSGHVIMHRSLSNMFAGNNYWTSPLPYLEQAFADRELAVAVYQDPQLFDESGIGFERLAKIRAQLCRVPGVAGTVGIDTIIGDRVLDEETAIPARVRKLFEGVTHGADGETVAVVCVLDPPTQSVSRSLTIEGLRRAMADLPDGLPAGTAAGEAFVIEDAFGYVDEERHHVVTFTTVVLALTLLAGLASIRWVIIAVAVVHLSLLLTNALLGLLKWELDFVSPMLTIGVTVVGVAAVVHVMVRYREARSLDRPPADALRLTCYILAVPVTWACVTNAIGFSALMFATAGPVHDFGLMIGIGSLMVLVSVLLIVPGLTMFGGLGSDAKPAWGERLLDASLLKIMSFVQRRPWRLALSVVLVTAASIWGLCWLEEETDFTRNFRRQAPMFRSYDVIESRLAGAGVLDVLVPAPPRLTWDFLRKVLVMENDLRENVLVQTAADTAPGLTKVISLADVVVTLSPQHPDRLRWKRMRNAYITSALRTMRKKMPELCEALYTRDPARTSQAVYRVMLRASERQPLQQREQIIAQVQAIANKHFPEAGTMGGYSLLTGLIHDILCDQGAAICLALLCTFLTMIIALRDFRLALIGMVPAIIPISMTTGLMGWLHLKLNLGGLIIATVSLALSVDCSIHYLLAYKRSLEEEGSSSRALTRAQLTVGRAMVLSTLSLILAFTLLSNSQLVPGYYFGSLVSFSMLCGLVSNLIWMPLLLRLTQRREPWTLDDRLQLTAVAQRG